MQDEGFGGKLGGEIEVDETFIGGKARNMHKGKRAEKIGGSGTGGKEIVLGIVERGGTVRTFHTDGRGKPELQRHIRQHVEAGSAIFTDELKSYDGLSVDFQHAVIDHAVAYVDGNIHTNCRQSSENVVFRISAGASDIIAPKAQSSVRSSTSLAERSILSHRREIDGTLPLERQGSVFGNHSTGKTKQSWF
jgi:transposase-like protein